MSNEVHEDQDKVTSHRRRRNNIIHSKGSSNAAVQKKIISWTTIEMERWKKSFRCSQFLPQTHICFAKTPLSSMYLLSDVLFYSPLNSYSEEYGELHEWSMTLLSKYYLKKKLHLDAVIDLTNPNLLYIEDIEYEDWDIEHISIYESSLDGDSDEILPSDYIIEKIINAIYNNRERNVVIITKYGDEISSLLCILYLVRCMNYSLEDAIPLCEKIKGARLTFTNYLYYLYLYFNVDPSPILPELPLYSPNLPPLLESFSYLSITTEQYRTLYQKLSKSLHMHVFNGPSYKDLISLKSEENLMITWNPQGVPCYLYITNGKSYLILQEKGFPIIIEIPYTFYLPPPPGSTTPSSLIYESVVLGTIVRENIQPPITRLLLMDLLEYEPVKDYCHNQPEKKAKMDNDLLYRTTIINKMIIEPFKTFILPKLDPSLQVFHIRSIQYFPISQFESIYTRFIPKLTHENKGVLFVNSHQPVSFDPNKVYAYRWYEAQQKKSKETESEDDSIKQIIAYIQRNKADSGHSKNQMLQYSTLLKLISTYKK